MSPSTPPGAKGYQCPLCSKRYARKDYLDRHTLNHRGVTNTCPLCCRNFARPDVLRRHLLSSCRASEGKQAHDLEALSEGIIPHKRRRRGKAGSDTLRSASPMQNDPSSSWLPQNGSAARQVVGSQTKTNHNDISTAAAPDSAGGFAALLGPFAASYPEEQTIQTLAPPMRMNAEAEETDPFAAYSLTFSSALGWDPPRQNGDNLDDVFGWLFDTSPLDQIDQSMISAIPPPGADTVHQTDSGSRDLTSGILGNSALNGPTEKQFDSSLPNFFGSPSSPNAPAPITPFTVFNQPISRPPPVFSPEWKKEAWPVTHPRDIFEDVSRAEMLDIVDSSSRDVVASVFTKARMSLYLELYFLHFAPMYPIIHRASLGHRRPLPDLIWAMICIGTAFAVEREGFHVAAKIHKRLRNRVLERVEEHPRIDLASLQTFLLVNHFSRSHCSLKQHDIAQIFHSPSIMLTRLSGVFLPFSATDNHTQAESPMESWLEWVAEEERVRCAWFAFMMDTENASLHRHWQMTHCFSLQIHLPCSEAVWTAPDPFQWADTLRNASPLPQFRHSLRELAGRGVFVPGLDDQALLILLHSLMSVSWALLFRDLSDFSIVLESKISEWKASLRRSFTVWREHIDELYCRRTKNSRETMDMPIYWAGTPFAHMGSILLLSDTEQIRIFAGASNIAGRRVSAGEWSAASAYLGIWAKSQDGAYSYYSAIELLSHVFSWSDESRFKTAPSIVGWCMYIASLVVWSYAALLEGQIALTAPYIIAKTSSRLNQDVDIEPYLARRDALAYLDRFKNKAHPFGYTDILGKNDCVGLVAYTAYLTGTLNRGILDEGRKVLVGLLMEHK